MARIRTVKPEFFRHHALYLAEQEERLPLRVAFAGLWTAADREGRFKWEPENLKLDCLPYDKVDFSSVLDALSTRGFIESYEADGRRYGWIPSFSRHQVINPRERESFLPNPLDAGISTRATTRDDALTDFVNPARGERKGKERKGKERDASYTRRSHRCPPDFSVTDEMRIWAETEVPGVDVDAVTREFMDFEYRDPKTDWPAAWRNWVRRSPKFGTVAIKKKEPVDTSWIYQPGEFDNGKS